MKNKKRNYKYLWMYIILSSFGVLSFYCFSFMHDILYQHEHVWTNAIYQGFIQLVFVYISIFAAFIVTVQFRYMDERKYKKELQKISHELVEKNKTIEKLNYEIIENKLYDTITHTWSIEYLKKYIHELCDRQIRKFCFIKIKCLTPEAKEKLLLHANFVLGKNTVIFNLLEDEYVFLFIGEDIVSARDEMDYIIPTDTKNLLNLDCDGYWDNEIDIKNKLGIGGSL